MFNILRSLLPSRSFPFLVVCVYSANTTLASSLYSAINHGIPYLPQSAFVPSPQLLRADGDMSIMLLSGNGVLFFDEMDDDWYRATNPSINISSQYHPSFLKDTYIPAEAGSPLACVGKVAFHLSSQLREGK